jgi:hypothetical protein
MLAQPSALQTVEIHQASRGFATPIEAAKFLRLSRAMGHKLIGERKMPAAATDVPYGFLGRGVLRPGASMKIGPQKT